MVWVPWNQPKREKPEAAVGFVAGRGHVYDWRKGSRTLSFGVGPKPNEVVVYRALPMPMGDVASIFDRSGMFLTY